MLLLSSSCSSYSLVHFSEIALHVAGAMMVFTSISRLARTTRGILRLLLEEHLSRPESQSLTENEDLKPLTFCPLISLWWLVFRTFLRFWIPSGASPSSSSFKSNFGTRFSWTVNYEGSVKWTLFEGLLAEKASRRSYVLSIMACLGRMSVDFFLLLLCLTCSSFALLLLVLQVALLELYGEENVG